MTANFTTARRLRPVPAETKALIVAEFTGGRTARQIARAHLLDVTQVDSVLAAAKVRRQPAGEPAHLHVSPGARLHIITDYRTGMPMADMVAKHGWDASTLRHVLGEAGVPMRRPATLGRTQRFDILDMHTDGMPVEELASLYRRPVEIIQAVITAGQAQR